MFTLKTKADIDNKDYRLWYKLNENTRIRVRTSVGESDSKSNNIFQQKQKLFRPSLNLRSPNKNGAK